MAWNETNMGAKHRKCSYNLEIGDALGNTVSMVRSDTQQHCAYKSMTHSNIVHTSQWHTATLCIQVNDTQQHCAYKSMTHSNIVHTSQWHTTAGWTPHSISGVVPGYHHPVLQCHGKKMSKVGATMATGPWPFNQCAKTCLVKRWPGSRNRQICLFIPLDFSGEIFSVYISYRKSVASLRFLFRFK